MNPYELRHVSEHEVRAYLDEADPTWGKQKHPNWHFDIADSGDARDTYYRKIRAHELHGFGPEPETDDDGNIVARYIETGPDHYAHAQTYAEIALPLAAAGVSARSISAFL